MITSFPEEYELLGFFEVEPKILDKGVPWMYNILTFEKILENETLVCIFSPSYGDLDLKLIQNGVDKLVLHLSYIDKVEVLKEKKGEHLRIKFKEDVPYKDFLLAIEPEVRIVWGTALE